MSKQSIKATIDANIKQNGVQAITGQIMNSVLNQMVDNLAEEASTTNKISELGVSINKIGVSIDGIDLIKNNALSEKEIIQNPTSTNVGYALNADGTLHESASYMVRTFNVEGYAKAIVSGRQPGAAGIAIAVAVDENDNVTPYVPTSGDYESFEINLPYGVKTLKVMGYIAITPGHYQPTAKVISYDFVPFISKDDMDIVEEEVASIDNPIVSVASGYISADQVIGQQISINPAATTRGYKVFAIPANSVVKVLFTELTGAYGFAITDTNDNVLESCTNQNKTDYTFALQTTPTKLWVSNNKYASSQRTTISKTDGIVALKELWESKTPNLWQGKKLWWCGTSIPAGSDSTLGSDSTIAGNYPKEVGLLLSASVDNVAEGGSMCRANVRTGDYQGANYANITSALSMTLEEVESFIANYDTIKSKLDAAPTSMTDAYKQRMREASFEVKLLPYLDGRKPMPDLFVIDHGHNDYKYKMPDNSSDITLEPTLANISGGVLAEDSFMTGNNNAKLESFFGSLANVPSAKKASFIASVNRNCYIGAINFIVTLILKYNPHARIMFVSNYEYQHGDNPGYAPLILAQQNISGSWAFPLCEVWKSLGYSNHIIPGSKSWFNTKYPNVTPATTDISVFRAYCPDMVHPHSDTTGDANLIYSVILSEFIKTIR